MRDKWRMRRTNNALRHQQDSDVRVLCMLIEAARATKSCLSALLVLRMRHLCRTSASPFRIVIDNQRFFLKMSSIKNTNEQECELDEAALSPVPSLLTSTAAKKSVETSEIKTINVSKEFVKVLQLSHDVMIRIGKERPSNKQYKIIKATKSKMNKLYNDIITSKDDEVNIDNLVFLARAYLYQSCIYTNRDNLQLDIAYSYIEIAIKLLKEKETECKVILAAIDAYHLLGSLYHIWNKHEKSLLAFEKALQLYLTYSEEEKYVPPINIIFSYISNQELNFEYALEQQCIIVLQDLLVGIRSTRKNDMNKINQIIIDKLVVHKRKLLRRILNIELPGEECIEWASQLMSLAEILANSEYFTAAKDHLAAASFMKTMYYKKEYETINGEINEEKCLFIKAERFDLYKEMVANIDWYWAKYGIQLMQSSREKLSRDTNNEGFCIECQFHSTVKKSETQSNTSLEFIDITQNLKEFIINIPDMHISCYSDAKKIFRTVIDHLYKAQRYFTFEKHRLKYINIMRDTAYAYECFASYEYPYETRQVELHKQRRQILIDIANKLDEENDTDILKPIWIEIASIASKILDIETVKLRYNTVDILNTESLNDPNKLVEQILCNWQLYLNCKY